jgi:hypothetical protein
MIALLLSLLLLFLPRPVFAINNPTDVPNNKYGIHIADFNDIPDLPALVNSSNGDWGYVTLVSTDNDRDHGRWQTMFDQMRRLHLIPIVRIATHVEQDYWAKPKNDSFDSIISFFQSLNWPVQNRYIVLYNEPNHAKEWGNAVDPEGYADTFVEFAKKLKAASDDYFVLPAGLDVSSRTDAMSLDAFVFLTRMIHEKPEILTLMDGWTSHSYPNPAFSGSPYATGRGTLRSYVAELALLQNLGLSKTLPVFITETGWTHNQGKNPSYNLLSPQTIGNNLVIAAQNVWSDPKIVAVTPFVFNYQDVPFDIFSWKKLGTSDYYAQYGAYQSIAKVKGEPIQKEEYVLSESLLPPTLVANSTYTLTTKIVNKGQGILNPSDEYEVKFDDNKKGFTVFSDPLPILEPNEKGTFTIHLKTPIQSGTYRVQLYVTHYNRQIPIQTCDITVVPPPSIHLSLQLGWRRTNTASDVTVIVYDGNTVMHKFSGLPLINGEVTAEGLTDIVPGRKYRIVALVPYYLPRQTIIPLGAQVTDVHMKRLLPFDIDGDGTLTPGDVVALFKNPPKDMIHLFISP